MAIRRQLRGSLRAAFGRAPDLQPPPGFAKRLREQVRVAAAQAPRSRPLTRRWLLLAASAALAVGLAGAAFMARVSAPVDALARDAIGDHWNCALKHRKLRTPIPLEEAAERFDSVYRVLLDAPPNEMSTPNGPVRVTDRHSCAFGTRRFGHVVLEYRQRVVSLLVTADDERPQRMVTASHVTPRLHGKPVSGLSVASIRGAHHAILLVSDLEGRELTQLSTMVSVPLMDRLVSGARPAVAQDVATLDPNLAIERLRRRGCDSAVAARNCAVALRTEEYASGLRSLYR
jgi:hypothetical protein